MIKVVKIGPIYPGFLEPKFFELKVDQGKIVGVDIEIGYAHRGIEKLIGERTYRQNIILTERICGICSNSHTTCFCNAVEKITSTKVPDRVRYIRTIMLELERLHSHYLFFIHLFNTLKEVKYLDEIITTLEELLSVLETISGNRINYAINTIGGIRKELTLPLISKIKKVMNIMESVASSIYESLDSRGSFAQKTRDIGILEREEAIALGVVGPTLRGSGIESDIRKDDPYCAYEELEFGIPTENKGDVQARAIVRVRECIESIKIIKEAIDNLPPGDALSDVGEVEIKEEIGRVEAPRGELVYSIKSNKTNIPESVKIRTPTFANNRALAQMLIGEEVTNAHLIIESIDPCISCTDR